MGLDMYLYRKTYVKKWDHLPPEQRYSITVLKGGQPCKDINPELISEITEQVAYWRKANQIHKWFVDHCMDGCDGHNEAYVEHKQLKELVDLCKRVLSDVEMIDDQVCNGWTWDKDGKRAIMEPGRVITNKAMAAKLLPTQEGFFFGSTDYDEYYVQDLQETIRQLEPLLDLEAAGDYYYHPSW